MGIDNSRRAADLLQAAVDSLRESHSWLAGDPDPSHEQFHRIGSGLTSLALAATDIAKALLSQVASYPDRYVLTDDAGRDPDQRIGEAVEQLSYLAAVLIEAAGFAGTYHSAIGHIAVQEGENGEPLCRH